MKVVDATNSTLHKAEGASDSSLALQTESAGRQQELDAEIEGTHITLKPHVHAPAHSELALDLAHPVDVKTEPAEVQRAVASTIPEPLSEPKFEWRSFLRTAAAGVLLSIRQLKPSRLERILLQAEEEGSITVEEVASKLHVSQAMATRYLAQLVGSGKLKRVGAHQSRYEPAVERDDF